MITSASSLRTAVLCLIPLSGQGFSAEPILESHGFVAPVVTDFSADPAPRLGEIVYDATTGHFYGADLSSDGWTILSQTPNIVNTDSTARTASSDIVGEVSTDDFDAYIYNPSSGAITVTLSGVYANGRILTITNSNVTNANAVTVQSAGNDVTMVNANSHQQILCVTQDICDTSAEWTVINGAPASATRSGLVSGETSGTFDANMTGGFSSAPSLVTYSYNKVGKQLFIYCGTQQIGTSNAATNLTVTPVSFPSGLVTRGSTAIARIRDNGVYQVGLVSLGTDGTMSIQAGLSGA